jgi:hypothetical protein
MTHNVPTARFTTNHRAKVALSNWAKVNKIALGGKPGWSATLCPLAFPSIKVV